MYPILFDWGPLHLRFYGLLAVLALLIAAAILKRHFQQSQILDTLAGDLIFILFVSGLFGARLTYVMLNWASFRTDILSVFKIWEGGLVFYGGFLAALGATWVFAQKKSIPFLKLTDLVAPALALGHAIGRLGCFMAGCCYGKPSILPWSVTFRHPESLAPLGIPLHPTQTYEALGNLILFGILFLLLAKKWKTGTTTSAYLIGYGVMRFFLEFFRGDERGFFWALSTSQWFAFAAVFAGLFLLFSRRRVSP